MIGSEDNHPQLMIRESMCWYKLRLPAVLVLVVNRENSEIVRIASVFVMQSHAEAYLLQLLEAVIPSYQEAPGLSAIMVLRRSLVGYEEISTITTWHSEEHMRSFFEAEPVSSTKDVSVQGKPPNLYQLVFDASRGLRNRSEQ